MTRASPKNRHRGADQWLFVVSGRGLARVNGHRYPLRAYTKSGDELSAAKR